MRKWPRTILAYGLMTAMVVAILEGLSFGIYPLLFHTPFSATTVEHLQKSLLGRDKEETNPGIKQDCVVHPYFGYVHESSSRQGIQPNYETNSAAELGFYSPLSLTPFDRRDRFFVAITGGSVAHIFATEGRETLLEHIRRLPEAQGKTIEIFDLSNWAYKQPQQLHVLTDLMHRGAVFDVVINIDGFNELALSLDNLEMGVSPFFPSQWWIIAGDFPSEKSLVRHAAAITLVHLRQRMAEILLKWPHTPFMGLSWRLLDTFLAGQSQRLRAAKQTGTAVFRAKPGDAIRVSANGRVMLGPNRDYKATDYAEIAAASWAASSALMQELVASTGGRYLHVLQPNQYVPGSKPLSREELASAFRSDSPFRLPVERGYPVLRTAGKALVEAGVHFTDLSLVFKDVPDTLYRDTCCHFGKAGNVLLGQAVGRALETSSPATAVSLTRLAELLHDKGVFDHDRLCHEAALDVDLLAEASPARMTLSGFADLEGKGEKRWRWGLGLDSCIGFTLPQAQEVRLHLALANPFAGQSLTVIVNGKVVEQLNDLGRTPDLVAPAPTLTRDFRLSGKQGTNLVELRYALANGQGAVLNPGDSRPMAVIFRQLRLTAIKPDFCANR